MKTLKGNTLRHPARDGRAAISTPLLVVLLLVAALAALGIASPPFALSAEEYTLGGNAVAVYNLAGTLRVERSSGSAVTVAIERAGKDADRLQVRSDAIDGRPTLRVIYPSDDIVYEGIGHGSSTSLRVRADGTFGGKNSGSTRRVTVRGSGRGMDAHADLVVRVPDGRRVEFHVGAGAANARDVKSDLVLDTGDGAVECGGIQGTLRIDTGAGSVRVSTHTGDLSIDTGSGGVTAEDVSGRLLHVDTGSGSVAVNRAKADKLDIDTGSGGVIAQGIGADDVRVDTGSGEVSVELLRAAKYIKIDSGSGGVLVRVPPDYSAEFELDSGSGGVDVAIPHTITKRDYGTLRGSIGSGSGKLYVDTGSGGIDIKSTGKSS